MAPILETDLLWPDEAAAQATAGRLAAVLLPSPNALIELHGSLGAGKTTFVRLLLRALGVQGRIKSPSYAVMESYELPESAGGNTASHFDFYRFGDPREWEDAGFRDVFAAPGLKLCEWPEKAAGQLPPADLQLFIELMPDDSRSVHAVGDARLVGALA
ncbi:MULTISPECIES: tRNA (adenosine(37)-N6)-threonylcarbamoyltransferase complex ATPase subunit type 1 TsaE [unclassified Roseateles]|uniref:tRNA (adenosine(37)-N6)-threonylcarbamoyltransferase complex ATPase subunit type 1 TsaE n=1 Tax=Pelomonas sp. Root1237 TaxID=1736434 RepID=UPI001F00CB13|nr:tRNA (adenosine(37)-N6)-threonylcarbamoyltransferase complex ATPase subunit type 1 TsaE [Pelomonas sp. Root1237]